MKICIIGSGLTALVLAKNLLKNNFIVHLYCKNYENQSNSVRSLGISADNLIFLNKNVEGLNNLAMSIDKIEIFTENNLNNQILNFSEENKRQFYIFKYFKIYNLFKKNLIKSKNFNVFKKINIQNLNLKKVSKEYDIVIDTVLSNKIGNRFFYNKVKKKYHAKAFTTIIKHSRLKNNIARQIFTKRGPIAYLPLSQYETSVVYSIKRKEPMDYNISAVKEYINYYNKFYSIKSFEKFESFDLKLSLLKNYHFKNILAFGDALHNIHPLAGQGFNMTIRDIKNLIKTFDKKTSLGLPVDETCLRDFENNFKYKNFLFANGLDLIYEFFKFENKIPKVFSKNFFDIVNRNSYLKNLSSKIANKGFNF